VQLYLIRHGIAVDIGENGVNRDSQRMLSEKGRKRTNQAMRGLIHLGGVPDCIFTSPLVRARETAEILSRQSGNEIDITEMPHLEPSGSPEKAIDWLSEQELPDRVAIVGHMPNIADLASILLIGTDSLCLHFKKSGVCSLSIDLEIEPGAAVMDWLFQPSQLRLVSTM